MNTTPTNAQNAWYILENVYDFNHDGLKDAVWAAPNWAAKDGENKWDVYVQLATAVGAQPNAPVPAKTYANLVSTYNLQDEHTGKDSDLLWSIVLRGEFDNNTQAGGTDYLQMHAYVVRNLDHQPWYLEEYMSGDRAKLPTYDPNDLPVTGMAMADAGRDFYTGTDADETRLGKGAKDAWIIDFQPITLNADKK